MLNFIPMPHTVYISKGGSYDSWGVMQLDKEEQAIKARVSYNTERAAINVADGEAITFTASIILQGVPLVAYTDSIRWVDALGNEYIKSPIQIQYKTDFSGNPVAVKVVV